MTAGDKNLEIAAQISSWSC